MFAKSKLNSIETLLWQTLIDTEISHEEIIAIFKEKDKYEKMKENMKNVSEKLEGKTENMRLNSVKSRKYWVCNWYVSLNSQKILSILCHQKKCLCVCIYKMVVKQKDLLKKEKLLLKHILKPKLPQYASNKKATMIFMSYG